MGDAFITKINLIKIKVLNFWYNNKNDQRNKQYIFSSKYLLYYNFNDK